MSEPPGTAAPQPEPAADGRPAAAPDYAGGDCATTRVEKNVLVTVSFKGRGATPEERTANCRVDGGKAMASALDAVGRLH